MTNDAGSGMRLMWLLLACTLGGPATPSEAPTPAPTVPAPPAASRLHASWILISWTGAGTPRTPRTREEARTLAAGVQNDLRHSADFATLARRWSDDSTGRHGGSLGMFGVGTYAPEVEAAVQRTPEGGVSDVIELPTGFAIVHREAPDELQLTWGLWSFEGALRPTSHRSKESAFQLAKQAADALRSGAPLPEADARSAGGGDRVGRAQWPPDLDLAAFLLAPGATSDPILTPEGWMVLQRAR